MEPGEGKEEVEEEEQKAEEETEKKKKLSSEVVIQVRLLNWFPLQAQASHPAPPLLLPPPPKILQLTPLQQHTVVLPDNQPTQQTEKDCTLQQVAKNLNVLTHKLSCLLVLCFVLASQEGGAELCCED